MADITRNTFAPAKNYRKVIIQRSRPVLDSELNEAQDNLRMNASEAARLAHSSLALAEAAVATVFNTAQAAGQEWAVYANGASTLYLQAGALLIDGDRFVLAADLDLSSVGLAFPAPAADTYGILYVDVVQTETGSTADPNLASAQLGETSRRATLTPTYHQAESTVSFDAAFAAIVPLAGSTSADRLWNNNTVRIFLGRYIRRAADGGAINSGDVINLLQSPISSAVAQRFVKTLRSSEASLGAGWTGVALEGAGAADGMVVWNGATGTLLLGVASGAASPDSYRTGLEVVHAASLTRHLASSTTGVVQTVDGGGALDGVKIVQDGTKGYALGAAGDALGWLTVGGAGSPPDGAWLSRSVAAEVVDVEPLPTAAPEPLLLQRLTVASLYTFQRGSPHNFVLCTRRGNDLVWFNGHVTRGAGARYIIDEPFSPGRPHDVVLAAEGATDLSLADGLERALEFLGDGGGNLGGARSLSLRMRRGLWESTRLDGNTWGAAAELVGQSNTFDTVNNALDLEGDGPEVSKVLGNTSAVGNEAIFAPTQLVAGSVRVRRLTFDQDASVAFKYTLYIRAHYVELDDVHVLGGGCYIVADVIRVKNCFFRPPGTGKRNLVAAFTAAPWVAQGLKLENLTGADAQLDWQIDGCDLLITSETGAHAGLVLETTAVLAPESRIRVRDSSFRYALPASFNMVRCPAIHVQTSACHVAIEGNRFLGADGLTRKGVDANNVPAPFDGDYSGTPMQYIGAATVGDGSTTAGGSKLVAAAYISLTAGRARGSSLDIANNDFDLTGVGVLGLGGVNGDYRHWGACIGMFNPQTLGASTAMYSGIRFQRNRLAMWSAGVNGWSSLALLATWGFYLAPTWQDCTALANVVVEDVWVTENVFDLGGDAINTTWRSILSADVGLSLGAVFVDVDSSCLVGVVLKNDTLGATSFTGRWAMGVVVKDNQFIQRTAGGTAALVTAGIITSELGPLYYWSHMILLALGGGPFITHGAGATNVATEGAASFYPVGAGQGQFWAPRVDGNTIIAPVYSGGSTSGYSAPIHLDGVYGGSVNDNYIYGADSTHQGGIVLTDCLRICAGGNAIKTGGGGVQTPDTTPVNYVAGNVLHGVASPVVNLVVSYPSGITPPGDNFTA